MEIWILIVVSVVGIVSLGDIRRELANQSMKLSVLDTQLDTLPERIGFQVDKVLSLQTVFPDKIAEAIRTSDLDSQIGDRVWFELMVNNKMSAEIGKAVGDELQGIQDSITQIANDLSDISNRS